MTTIILLALTALVVAGLFLAVIWRRVVPTNMVHIVQSGGKTTSYGAGQKGGNVYYAVPSFIPVFGVLVSKLPTSNFEIKLKDYDAYDKDRGEFVLDVIGFFVINDTNAAAQRSATFERLREQLDLIMRGAARKIMASHDINEILGDRATFGKSLTAEVDEGLKEWGVRTIQSMELLDIRDHSNGHIISDIKAKKAAAINADSRRAVAESTRMAETAEIDARQAVELRTQEQVLAVGQRTAAVAADVGVAKQLSEQQIFKAAAETATTEMAVKSVETQRAAEIAAAATVTKAEGELNATKLTAQGTQATGEAVAEAKRLLEMSTVTPQLALAAGTTGNKEYQDYLVRQAEVAATRDVGIAQATALAGADIKIIANSDGIATGLDGARGMLTSRTGQGLGAILEGLKNTPEGAALLAHLTGGKPNGHATDGRASN